MQRNYFRLQTKVQTLNEPKFLQTQWLGVWNKASQPWSPSSQAVAMPDTDAAGTKGVEGSDREGERDP